jgi:elongation factor P
MSISLHSLRKGMFVEIDGEPNQVLEADFLRMQQRKPVVRTKLKSLISGKTIEKSFKPSDKIEEAEINKSSAIFFYQTKDEIFFQEKENKIGFPKEEIADKLLFLTKGTEVSLMKFNGKVIDIELPPKVDLKVKFAPEGNRGDTSQGKVTKKAEMETGLEVNVPLFVKEGDVIRISTELGNYVERVN